MSRWAPHVERTFDIVWRLHTERSHGHVWIIEALAWFMLNNVMTGSFAKFGNFRSRWGLDTYVQPKKQARKGPDDDTNSVNRIDSLPVEICVAIKVRPIPVTCLCRHLKLFCNVCLHVASLSLVQQPSWHRLAQTVGKYALYRPRQNSMHADNPPTIAVYRREVR
jgi:hypothetical protein